jgi:hypothetical protein
VLTVSSCATSNESFNKKQYNKSKTIATYKGAANELQDGYLILKENGYFKFYQKLWLVVNIKQGEFVGRYSQTNDTLYLNWLNKNPKQVKYYLSNKCLMNTTTKSVWFIDEISNQRLWVLGLTLSR